MGDDKEPIIYQLRVVLDGVSPLIWRRLLVPTNYSIADLHADDVFAIGDNHINGIVSFWSFAERRLHEFNGVAKHTFYLHLKELEYSFNHQHENLQQKLLKFLERYPL